MNAFAVRFCFVTGLVFFSSTCLADADLAIIKTGPSTVVAGTDLLYEVTVYNDGPDPATDVVVTDIFSLPPLGEGEAGPATCTDGSDNDSDGDVDEGDLECEGLIYVGATADCELVGGTATEGTVDCDLDPIDAGSWTSFTIKFHVSPGYLLKKDVAIYNTATVGAAEVDPDSSNNVATVDTIVEEVSDLRISKFVEPVGEIAAGETFWYTIWVDNLGPSAASTVTIIDTLLNSGDVTIQSCAFSVSQGGGSITQFTCTTGTVVQTQFGSDVGTFRTDFMEAQTPWNQGRLRASFRMVANTDIDVTNTARVTADQPDPDMGNNEASVNIDVYPVADLAASALFASEVQVNGQHGLVVPTGGPLPPFPQAPNYDYGGTNVTAGRRIEFTGHAVNNGPSPAHNVMLEFLLPAGASVLANTLDSNPTGSTAMGNCYTEPAGEPRTTVICIYDTLEDGDVAEARFQLLIDQGVPDGTQSSIDFIASSDEFDPALFDNVGGLQFNVNNWADRALNAFAIGQPVAGTQIHYELQVSNDGPSTAYDLTVRDFLPDGVTFVNAYVDYEGVPLPVLPALPCGVTEGSNALFCELGEVPPTGSLPVLVFVNVQLDSDLAEGTLLVNSADVFLSDTPDPFNGDNSDSVQSVVVTRADLELVKTATADIYPPSAMMTFKLKVTNKGPSTAKNIVVVDTLPPPKSATYVSDSGGCVRSGVTLTCDFGTWLTASPRK